MRRIGVLLAGLAIGLGLVAVPLPADAVTVNCGWQTIANPDPLFGEHLGELKAGPFLEPGASSVLVTCQVRVGDPEGPVHIADTQSTPGPVGVYSNQWLVDVRSGTEMYLCTYTLAQPAGAIKFHGCHFGFHA